MTHDIEGFLKPLYMDSAKAHAMSREYAHTFRRLAAESKDQFLPTPISEGILRPEAGQEKGRYVLPYVCLVLHEDPSLHCIRYLAIDMYDTKPQIPLMEIRTCKPS